MAVYATYDYYTTQFFGTAIDAADFPRLAMRASRRIDRLTFDRADAIITADTPAAQVTAIKMATCAVADQMQANTDEPEIQSEKLGQRTITYAKKTDDSLSDDDRILQAAREWLADTGLMFPGFNDGEYAGSYDADAA